jgi:hypothetical protein
MLNHEPPAPLFIHSGPCQMERAIGAAMQAYFILPALSVPGRVSETSAYQWLEERFSLLIAWGPSRQLDE